MMRTPRLALGLGLALGLVFGGGALAEDDFLDHYKAGLGAIARRDWPAAAASMRQAIAGKAEEDPRLAKKLYLKRYLPHYYLGKALFESGDCSGALAAWAESERQGVVAKFDEAKELARAKALCNERLEKRAAFEAELGTARRALGRAEEAARRISGLAAEPSMVAVWGRGEPSFQSRQREALALLDQAKAKLDEGERGAATAPLQEASSLAAQVTTRLDALAEEARQSGEAEQAARAGLSGQLSAAIEAGRSALGEARFLDPAPPEVGRRKAELEKALKAAEGLDRGAPQSEFQAAAGDLESAAAKLRRALAPPPPELLRGAESFFRGDYERALEQLRITRYTDPRATAHAALFRAASRYALYLRGGSKDASLLAAVEEEIRLCRSADPERVPQTSAFSPRFVELFASLAGSR